ncbi:MAG: NHL repeat-containing protein [Deltaproteobacteria bacterium]|nr:NHL repeat-containing protein [Deltaproteobacteria bacterium]
MVLALVLFFSPTTTPALVPLPLPFEPDIIDNIPQKKAEPIAPKIKMTPPILEPRFKFEINSYFKLPFKKPQAIFVDNRHQEIYVVDSYYGEIFIFDLEARPVARIGKGAMLGEAIDMIVREGKIYITQDGVDYVQVLDYKGKTIARLAPEDTPFMPADMDIDEDGNIYIVNKSTRQCVVLDTEDKFSKIIGPRFASLSGVAVGGGRVYLLTPLREDYKVRVFSTSGEFVSNLVESETGRGAILVTPIAGKIDSHGRLWVIDRFKGIQILSSGGELLGVLGRAPTQRERVSAPRDVDFDVKGMVYLLSKRARSIKVYK